MLIKFSLYGFGYKPIIPVTVGANRIKCNALIDTGATKVLWCSANMDINSLDAVKLDNSVIITGVVNNAEEACVVYKTKLGLYSSGRGIIFDGLEIAKMSRQYKLFDMIIPYALLRNFEFSFKPADSVNKYGTFVLDTLNNKINHTVVSLDDKIIDVNFVHGVSEVYAIDDNTSVMSDELPDIE